MADKKRVTIGFDDWWTAVVEIDNSAETLEAMKQQLLHWANGQTRIDSANGDIEKAYLIMLAETIIKQSIVLNVKAIRAIFDDKEGWADLRGGCGVKLISCDKWCFDPCEFSFSENIL